MAGRISQLKDQTYKEHPPKTMEAKMKAAHVRNKLVLLKREWHLDPV